MRAQVPGEGQKLAAQAVSSGKPSHLLPGSPPGRGRSHAPARPPRPCPQRGPASREFPRVAPRPSRVGGRSVGGGEQPGHQNRSRLWAGAALAGSLRRASSKDGQRVRRRPRPRSPLARGSAARPGAAAGEFHVCPELEKESRRILCSRFKEVWQQEEFLEISLEKFLFILSRKNLSVWKEEAVIEPVIKWTAHDVENRIECLYNLLSYINIDIDPVYLKTALGLQRSCLLTENKIRSLIYNALNPMHKEISQRSTATMYIIGGYYWHPLSEVHVWDPLTNVWIQGAEIPDYTRESYGVTCLGPNIYVTGGYRTDNIEALDTVWIYNSESDEWTEGLPMLNARYYHCAVTLGGCVYALGGYRKGAPAEEAEFYDPLKEKWIPIANMIKGVGNATACVLHEVIYVIGGHCGYRGSCTYDKVQSYNSDINEWSLVTSSPHPEYGLCSVPFENKLYLVGGQTTITECYDPEQNEWREIAPMMERRMECGAVIMNGCIYVTGGYSYSKGTYLQSIEKYDPDLNKWEIVGNLPSAMRSHGCVCVYNV
ncbi:kelch-like protein 23 isoform X5 [Balaenoptera acutorostrata]|uniref:Kelch-like protein 23 isoform X5 n=1 Tax=Balaenoptera acutorostrata TaxID=9767 RepID=A0ABM3TZ87_BALAC|nr:kelch-like protein 23 isoform X5 [Balaenoptera acutorostrata]